MTSPGSGSRTAGQTAARTGCWRRSATTAGASFADSAPHFSNCAGGTAANGGNFGRSSDPFVSWAPNGDLWSISLSVDQTTARNAVLAARMRHGTSTWSEERAVHAEVDESRTGLPQGNNFNDKESLTAERTDPSGNLVYAVWDRFVSPSQNATLPSFENARAFHEPVWFSRTTNGAADNPTWHTREIFDPGTKNGTIRTRSSSRRTARSLTASTCSRPVWRTEATSSP